MQRASRYAIIDRRKPRNIKHIYKQILLILAVILISFIPLFHTTHSFDRADLPQIDPEDDSIQGVNDPLSDLIFENDITPRLVDLAHAIKDYEGYYANTVAVRNNNPGNLRYSPYMTGQKDGFAYFDTYDEGWRALLWQLQIAVDGRSGVYNPEMTLYEFFGMYAPSSDDNAPVLYAESVARTLSVSPETKIKYFN